MAFKSGSGKKTMVMYLVCESWEAQAQNKVVLFPYLFLLSGTYLSLQFWSSKYRQNTLQSILNPHFQA